MLPQRLRLPLRKEGEFFDKAKRRHLEGVTSFFVDSKKDFKMGVIVKKSDFPLSTTRHKITRKTHQALEQIATTHPHYTGYYTFVMSKSTLMTPTQNLKQILQKHFDINNP